MYYRNLYVILFLLFSHLVYGRQSVAIDPSISPSIFQPTDQITVTYDVTGTPLATLTDAYIWVWIPGKNIDAKYNIQPASSNPTVTNVIGPNGPKFTKSVVGGSTLFTIVFKPSDFFTTSIINESTLGMLLKGNSWENGQTTDYIANFGFTLQLTSPAQLPAFVDPGVELLIESTTPLAADYVLEVNGVVEDSQFDITTYSYLYTVPAAPSAGTIKLTATTATEEDVIEFQYILSVPSPTMARPSGIIPGINYHDGDDTKVTLCLWAPLKNSVYAVGDFNEWEVSVDHLMNRDGEYFWIELDGITPGEEYAFQYLVNETIWVADPYADKILDPDDQYIPESSYPDLKPFPSEALHSNWYENRASVFQTAQTPYVWQVTDFEKPAKEELVVYELLIRDFFEDGNRNYQTLIDTISYFRRLGINAIELMPVMEFNGNEGWGYNPTFMFAPDKYYGTKNKLKEFVDICHQNGIAVILDIAMNHQDVPNTYASMYFDFVQFKPAANNPWFNVTPRHPFNVFFDMNHASSYTQSYLDTINYYWLNEYKVDGFRFDLSKGFTQKNTGSDVGAWSAYDASRIFILKRMADKIWDYSPDAYVILEHLSENTEEKELAQYRAGEGKGMMLWGKMTEQYNQNTMGYSSNSDISGVYHASRGWSAPRLVGYMESHDEERLMWKNFEYGNAAGNYNVKTESIALRRMQAAGLVFYTIPGPKMLWQFGELGYDKSINTCEDGSVNPPGAEGGDGDCRLSEKPLLWSYQDNYNRVALFDHTADLLRLKKTYDVFSTGDATISGGSTLLKQVSIKNSPYTATPADASEMNVHIVVNFDVTMQSIAVNFPHTGTWYDYYLHGLPFTVTTTPTTIELQPGGYKLFTDIEITNPLITGVEPEMENAISLYPNPVQNILRVASNVQVLSLSLHTLHGVTTHPIRLSSDSWDVSSLGSGMYFVDILTPTNLYRVKLIKNNK